MQEAIDPDVHYWLCQWVRHCHVDENKGFPNHSAPFISGGESQRMDDWSESQWDSITARNSAIMDTLVWDLPKLEREAVIMVYTGSPRVYRRRGHKERYSTAEWLQLWADALDSASALLLQGMRRKGII